MNAGDVIMQNPELLSLARSYLDQRGISRVWEDDSQLEAVQVRADAVGVIAFYRRLLHYDCIVLLKQYRPELKTYTIEMPTGFTDDNQTPEETALRELEESTGFSGTVKKVGPVLAMDPGLSNCAMRLVTVEVNGDEPGNLQAKSRVSSQHFREPLLVPVSELLEKLSAYAAAGFLIDSRIDAFAIGLVMGNRSRKPQIPTTLM